MSSIRSSLASVAGACREPDPANARRKAREAYRDTDGEIVLINRSWLDSWSDQKQLEILAEKAGVKPRKD
jgi:hypothetical protein